MYLKTKGTVLISTVIILSLMSFLGCSIFKMMTNNNEIGSLYKFHKDIYDLDKKEEEILNKFMKELNKNRTDNLNTQNKENTTEINIFSEDFKKTIESSILEYHKKYNKIYLTTQKNNTINRKREIKYIFSGEKVILVPTYKFDDI